MQLMCEQKLDEALDEAQTAVDVAPNRAATHMARSTILAAMGRTAEAGDEIARARTIADVAER
jgi:Flp pilus assembly protein TadD